MAIPDTLPAVVGYQVESSNVDLVGYDGDERLYLRFLSGETYVYADVSKGTFLAIATANLTGGSCGKTYNRLIKNSPPGQWKRIENYLFACTTPAERLLNPTTPALPPKDILAGWVVEPDARNAAWSW